MSIPGDDGLVVSSRCDYQLKDFPPPFDDTDDCNFTADEAGPPRKRLRGSSKSPTFDGSSVLIRHLEPNRPDLAVIETDHFPRDLEELQPCVDGGKSHPPDLQNSGHEARFLLEEERKSLPSSRKGNSSHSIVGSEGGNVAREQDTPSPSAEQPNLKENEPHVARSDSLPCLAPRQVRKLSDPDPRLIKLLTRPSSPITSSPITTNLPDLKAVLSGFNNRPGHPSADSDHISEAPAPSLDPLKSELLFPQSGLLDVQVIVRAWTTLSRDELNV
ncbi:hypothetical protein BO94DRAFT_535104 [Aspergillus sclerotioniger CBS 115572]|uniref:Uncharacterized protein n=1 Tax=Aspergillus sclerotioniger CBS 115572 TaxID=1450535 RepID=A0A317WPX5_9EURO|nr:hypothetical protein BO94DRAFT_535104 [Aspergillus sclerotioniger CBS 115572]PWY88095.1 hypothetical protein BO94DRAFT_535104 [Aspergillus sclerotioniger CBS 115572]